MILIQLKRTLNKRKANNTFEIFLQEIQNKNKGPNPWGEKTAFFIVFVCSDTMCYPNNLHVKF